MAQVQLRGVAKRYGQAAAVQGIDLTIEEGSFVSLLGPSGSGKTTLLRLVAGFIEPDEGSIRIGDRVVNRVPPHKRNIGMVFQNYALFPHRTVAANVAFGLEMRGIRGAEAAARVAEALEMVQLSGRGDAFPRELSGGQQQRVAIARSLVVRPALLLLDEPLSALDRKLRAELQVELRALQRQLRITALYVTHDQEEALALSDRIAILRDGRIAQHGSARELYEQPANAFVADFLGSANLLDAELVQDAGAWAARLEGETVPVRAGEGFRAGQRVKLALRPERLALCGREDLAGRGGLRSTITGLVYLGSDLRVLLRTAGGAKVSARLALAPGVVARPLAEGDEVYLAWQPEEAVVVAG